MPGIRLHHPTLRRATYVVELDITYPVPYVCPNCAKVHVHKALHLRLDEQGDVIVAEPVWRQLERLGEPRHGLKMMNEVLKPPPLVIGAVEILKQEVVESTLNAQNGQRFYRPGMTKYQSRDRMRIRIPRMVIGRRKRKEN